MAYEKQNFQPNTTLYANDLNEMDTQIASNETEITKAKQTITNIQQGLSAIQSSVSDNTEDIAGLNLGLSAVQTENSNNYNKIVAISNDLLAEKGKVSTLETKLTKFNGKDEDALYIVDKNNNVIAVIDRNGILSTNFLIPNANMQSIAEKNNITSSLWKSPGQYISLALDGLNPGERYTIELIRRPSNCSDNKRWVPIEPNYGYKMLAGYISVGNTQYGPVPSFMLNDGVLKNKWRFTATDSSYKLVLHAPTWLLDLCKPCRNISSNFTFAGEDGECVNLIGQHKERPYKMLAFSFNIYNESDNLIHRVPETLFINGFSNTNADVNPGLCLRYNDISGLLQLENLRITIK